MCGYLSSNHIIKLLPSPKCCLKNLEQCQENLTVVTCVVTASKQCQFQVEKSCFKWQMTCCSYWGSQVIQLWLIMIDMPRGWTLPSLMDLVSVLFFFINWCVSWIHWTDPFWVNSFPLQSDCSSSFRIRIDIFLLVWNLHDYSQWNGI